MNWYKKLDRTRQIALGIATILGAFTAVGTAGLFVCNSAWSAYAVPKIDEQIGVRLTPVEETLRFQNYLMMQQLDSAALSRAIHSYETDRDMRARGYIK